MKNEFMRARSPDQKEIMRAHLMKTARSMVEIEPELSSVGLNQLAKKSNMAKSNVYRYFETREALLLELLFEEWNLWYQMLIIELNKSKGKYNQPATMVKLLANSTCDRPLLCKLTAALPSVLEVNLCEETIRKFKFASLDFLHEVGRVLEEHAPLISAKEYAHLINDVACLMPGLYLHSHPAKAVANVLEEPKLNFFKRSFKKDLTRLIQILFNEYL